MVPGRDRVMIRQIKEADLDAIAYIEAGVFARPLTRGDLVTLWRKPAFRGFLLAPDGGVPASYVLFLIAGGVADLVSTATAGHAQRRGYAMCLLRESLRRIEVDAVTLEVAVDNVRALGLYAGLGFAEVGRRPDYYRRPAGRVDALILRWRPEPQGSA